MMQLFESLLVIPEEQVLPVALAVVWVAAVEAELADPVMSHWSRLLILVYQQALGQFAALAQADILLLAR